MAWFTVLMLIFCIDCEVWGRANKYRYDNSYVLLKYLSEHVLRELLENLGESYKDDLMGDEVTTMDYETVEELFVETTRALLRQSRIYPNVWYSPEVFTEAAMEDIENNRNSYRLRAIWL